MLLIVESPTKIRTIRKYLPAGWEVAASVGHIRDLPRRELGVDKANAYRPEYEIIPEKRKVVAELKSRVARAGKEGVVLATDLKINAVIEVYPKGIAGFRRYTELLDTAPDIVDRPGARAVSELRGEIRYRDVRFGYSPGKEVLTGINLEIHAGETVAFVGPSGAGKTTLCSLLPRFYEITGGSITIDGIDVRDMTLASLRAQIGIVQQDVFLFAGTVRENIAYGRLGATEAEIIEAARRARLDEVIAALPNGLDTVIGERGVKLSGGQKQRLAIARMFLKNPPILILDEATSALDTETERAIQASLAELSAGRTTLVIAHRLATIQDADRIVVVDETGIAEEGRHQDLVGSRGIYRRLYEAQYGLAAHEPTART